MANPSKSGRSAQRGRSNEGEQEEAGFERVAGPGPKDAGKGAAGREAIDRIEGGPERSPEGRDADEAEDEDEFRDV